MNRKKSTGVLIPKDKIIELCKAKHGDNYSYILVHRDSIGADAIPIICPTHGIFHMSINDHKRGTRCPTCHPPKLSQEEYIERFIKANGDFYLYYLVNYVSPQTRVDVICPIHGIFETSPDNHERGRGCPLCSKNKIYKDRPTYLYHILIHNGSEPQHKIGVCLKKHYDEFIDALNYRYSQEIKANISFEVVDFKLFENGEDAYALEQEIVDKYKHLHIHKDNLILLSGYTETYDQDCITENNLFI